MRPRSALGTGPVSWLLWRCSAALVSFVHWPSAAGTASSGGRRGPAAAASGDRQKLRPGVGEDEG